MAPASAMVPRRPRAMSRVDARHAAIGLLWRPAGLVLRRYLVVGALVANALWTPGHRTASESVPVAALVPGRGPSFRWQRRQQYWGVLRCGRRAGVTSGAAAATGAKEEASQSPLRVSKRLR